MIAWCINLKKNTLIEKQLSLDKNTIPPDHTYVLNPKYRKNEHKC